MLLLDTHAFLWSAFDTSALSHRARAAVTAAENEVLVSVVSFWELSLKFGIGKLELQGTAPERFPAMAAAMGFDVLPLEAQAAASFHQLPRDTHRDPFDRMLVWQAISRGIPLVTKDPHLAAYAPHGLEALW